MKKKLTPKLIENLPPASGKRYEVRDELLTGLLLRVSATGAKVWYLATRIDGRSRRIKLGSWPVLSLKDAREKAQMILRDIQLGLFQRHEDEPAPKSLTLGDVIPQFIEKHAKRHTKDWKGTESVLLRMNKLHGLRSIGKAIILGKRAFYGLDAKFPPSQEGHAGRLFELPLEGVATVVIHKKLINIFTCI
ncbi:Arm DNA-binding domain-containing protein [Martelella sp. HB161492]|uniref:Arm DNA-binding domain-containing protein n=1 Tax=Martelella sp. HB161492 TaxID=2720726 RepID=UPI0015904A6D|nr:Arm DNA-binding domain-containing protein [Martelella sp. HB161492]